ncbi:DUF4129 domain-containing protein [Sphingomonas floccifaciens]|uniref:DUF4129 domain-containing protein n=1 Tax=Sphingomonas floccifaciens TaxID=1844115 RepID=A0ABW4NDE7_9SPHN
MGATGDWQATMAGGGTDERLAAAHRALREGRDIQFDLLPAAGPPPTPEWVKTLGEWFRWALSPIGRMFRWLTDMMPEAPYARIVLWAMIAVLALLILRVVVDRVRNGEWRMPTWRRRQAVAALDEDTTPGDWSVEAAPARRWLEEADRLAADGRFAEAVHHILLRSVEDIARRRPHLVRPALTSRDIARAPGIPEAPRTLFGDLAAVVERSLFGGAAVDAGDWQRCRAAYAAFAVPKAWKA